MLLKPCTPCWRAIVAFQGNSIAWSRDGRTSGRAIDFVEPNIFAADMSELTGLLCNLLLPAPEKRKRTRAWAPLQKRNDTDDGKPQPFDLTRTADRLANKFKAQGDDQTAKQADKRCRND